jgi:hypothetical protein
LYIEENTGDPPWSNPEAIDLAFTKLSDHVAAILNATSVFLSFDKNWKKFTGGEPGHHRHVDAVFGLVDEFSGEPVACRGLVTTPMKGILTPGHVVRREQGAMTLECMSEVPDVKLELIPRPDLPWSSAGEAGTVATVAAVANAVFDAVGKHPRRLPLSPDHIRTIL